MKTVSISDARNHLPSLIEEVMKTREQVVVMRYGTPVASILPFRDMNPKANHYPLRGHPCKMAEDFNEPIPDLWEATAVAETPVVYRSGQGVRSRHNARTASGGMHVSKGAKRKGKGAP